MEEKDKDDNEEYKKRIKELIDKPKHIIPTNKNIVPITIV